MPFLSFIQQTIPDLRLATVVGTVTLFAIPSTLLGMVSPYAVKLKMRALANSGETVGELYAISTVGSITGTFLSGFFLLTHIGNTNLLFLIALILIATSLIANRSKYLMMQIMAIAAVLLAIYLNGAIHRALAGRSVLDIDTPYQRVLVYDSTDRKTGRRSAASSLTSAGLNRPYFWTPRQTSSSTMRNITAWPIISGTTSFADLSSAAPAIPIRGISCASIRLPQWM